MKKDYIDNAEVSDAPAELMAQVGPLSSELSVAPAGLKRPKKAKKPKKIEASLTQYPEYKVIKNFSVEKGGRHFIFPLVGNGGEWVSFMVNMDPYFGPVVENAKEFYYYLKNDEKLEMKRVTQNPNVSDKLLILKAKRMILDKFKVQDDGETEQEPVEEESKPEPSEQEFPFATEMDDKASHMGAIMAWFDNYRAVTADSVWTQSQVYCEDGTCYDVEKLIETTKTNGTTRVKVEKLVDQLHQNAWGDKSIYVSPISVIRNPVLNRDHKIHMRRIQTADMSYPILIRFSDGKVIDGYHRLARAFMSKDRYITVIYIQDEQMTDAKIES